MSAKPWYQGQAPAGDLVDRMHNAGGAFYAALAPCPCTGRLEICKFEGSHDVPSKWWIYCHGCSARSQAALSVGEAVFVWNARPTAA